MLVRKPHDVGISKVGTVELEEKEVSTIPIPVVIQAGTIEGDVVTVSQFECVDLSPINEGIAELVESGEFTVAEIQAAVNAGFETLLGRRERSKFMGELKKKHGIVSTSTGEAKTQEFIAFS